MRPDLPFRFEFLFLVGNEGAMDNVGGHLMRAHPPGSDKDAVLWCESWRV